MEMLPENISAITCAYFCNFVQVILFAIYNIISKNKLVNPLAWATITFIANLYLIQLSKLGFSGKENINRYNPGLTFVLLNSITFFICDVIESFKNNLKIISAASEIAYCLLVLFLMTDKPKPKYRKNVWSKLAMQT
jgi:hypothetical protein